MASRRRSAAWEFFEIKDEEKCVASCNICHADLSYRGSVTNLMKHVRTKHTMELSKANLDENNDTETETEEKCKDTDDDEKLIHYKGDDDDSDRNDFQQLEIVKDALSSEQKTRNKWSAAWEHFEVKDAERRVASCNLCGVLCSYRSSVSNLMKHVRRKHGVRTRRSAGEDASDSDADNSEVHPDMMKAHRNIVWLYFKNVDPEAKLAQCLVCKKMLSHSTTLTNLKKHLARKHPNVGIPGRPDGTKRVLMASGGELFEVETADPKTEVLTDYDNETLEMDTVYLEDFDALDQPSPKRRKLTKTKNNKRASYKKINETSSEEEVTFRNKYVRKPSTALDHYGKYVATLLKQLPKQISNQLQMDFVKQIMDAQLSLEAQTQVTQVTDDTQSNAYSITITKDPQVETGTETVQTVPLNDFNISEDVTEMINEK